MTILLKSQALRTLKTHCNVGRGGVFEVFECIYRAQVSPKARELEWKM